MLDAATLQTFRECLAAHAGQELSTDLCHILDGIVRFGPDRSIDPAQFEPEIFGTYTIRAERFVEIFEELEPIHAEHWQETEKHRHGLALNPNYDLLFARERAGQLLQFVARAADGSIAGHVRMYLGTSVHTSTLFAEEDTLFMRPQHRGGYLVVRLLRYAERALRRVGAREIRADSKLLNDADVLMKRMKYTPVALKFHKFFED